MDEFDARRYEVDGRELSKEDCTTQPFMVAGTGLPDAFTVYGFSTEESFYRWAADTKQAVSFARSIGTAKLCQQLAGTETESRALRRQQVVQRRLQEDLKDLEREAQSVGIDPSDRLAMACEQRSILEGPYFDLATLYADLFSGDTFVLTADTPWGTFFDFNNRATSARVFGSCTLFDGIGFQGRRLDLFGFTGVKFRLEKFDFDDMAESGFSSP